MIIRVDHVLMVAKIWANSGQSYSFATKGDFSGKIHYHHSRLLSNPHHSTFQTNPQSWLLDKMLDNFGSNRMQIAHLPQKSFLGKLTVAIVYQLYSFRLQQFEIVLKSSKSKSCDKRLHNFGPNWMWHTSLKKFFLGKLTNIALV